MKTTLKAIAGGFAFAALSFTFSSCADDDGTARIDACRNLKSTGECRQCCINNGYDSGSYRITEDVCECINM